MKTLFSILLISICINTYAQPQRRPLPPGDRKENVEAMKIAYLTRQLDLTTEEAKQFWPVYNQFTDELHAVRIDRRDRMQDAREEFDKMSDKEVEKVIDAEILSREKELEILKKYHQQFKAVLPMKKVARLYRAEEGFKRELLDRIRDRKDGPDGR